MEWARGITEYWQAGGWLLTPIALVAFGIWAYALRLREWLLSVMTSIEPLDPMQVHEAVRRDVLILKALTAAAPLLGLLGTVTGMVDLFMAVAGPGAEGATLVAGGISRALITTQFGLLAALPGVFGLLYIGRLRNRVDSVVRRQPESLVNREDQRHGCRTPGTEPRPTSLNGCRPDLRVRRLFIKDSDRQYVRSL